VTTSASLFDLEGRPRTTQAAHIRRTLEDAIHDRASVLTDALDFVRGVHDNAWMLPLFGDRALAWRLARENGRAMPKPCRSIQTKLVWEREFLVWHLRRANVEGRFQRRVRRAVDRLNAAIDVLGCEPAPSPLPPSSLEEARRDFRAAVDWHRQGGAA
jgi:hypothetical protein